MSAPSLPTRTLICIMGLVAALAPAQDFQKAATAAQTDLDKALADYGRVTQEIADAKIPLARKLNELEAEVADKRREASKSQGARDSGTLELNTLKTQVNARQDEIGYLSSLLGEYVRAFEARVHISELQRYHDLLQQAKDVAADQTLDPSQRFEKQIAVVKASLDRALKLMGGDTFDGHALSPKGTMEEGRFALIGPVGLFSSKQSPAKGIVEFVRGSTEPTVIQIGPQFDAGIESITTTGSGDLPFDPTLGSAVKIESVKETWLEHLAKGGPVMVPILLLGITALAVSLVKYLQIARVRVARPQDLQGILQALGAGETEQAITQARSIRGPAGELLVSAIEHAKEPKEFIEEVLYEKMLSTKPRLERMLPFIALTAACAPLLGLLGTVTGMINTFNLITIFGTGDPKLLSSGISEALITTEYGLIIAVPALLVHAIISRKAKGVLASMERTAVGFINGIPEGR